MKPLAVVLILALVLPGRALAAPRPAPAGTAGANDEATRRAKEHFRRGSELYRQARYRDAIAEFEAAQRLRPHPVMLYNLAQCHERLGDIPAALRAYRDYLRAEPGAEDRATVEAAMANLQARLGASGVQQLLVYSQPAGAEVHVDGQPRGSTPLALVLPLGRHTVAVSRPGFVTQTRDAFLTVARSAEVDVVLTSAEPPAAAKAPEPPPAPAGAGTAGRLPPELAPSPSAPAAVGGAAAVQAEAAPAARPRVWTWVAAGVTGAALAAAIAYGISAQSASQDIRNVQYDPATAQRLADTASSRARTANVLYGVAAAAGVAGVTLFFVEGTF